MLSVSIALATFNGEKYLALQLQSLAAQTVPPSELVLCDDLSHDSTLEIARDFAKRAPFPVRIFRNETRQGFSGNFMGAAARCEADLVAFCDQDDVWHPSKIAVMRRSFENPDVLLAFHNATLIDADGNDLGRLYDGTAGVVMYPPLTRHPWLVVPGFAQMFRRELTRFSHLHPKSRDVDWLGESLPHDRWFFLIASVLGSIAFIKQPLVRYRQHGENAFGVYTDERSHADRLKRGEHFVRAGADAAKNRADLLREMVSLSPAQWQERLSQGIAYYEGLHRRLEDRIAVYASASWRTRVMALYKLLRQGAYGETFGSARFSRNELVMDMFRAVPLGPRLRKRLGK